MLVQLARVLGRVGGRRLETQIFIRCIDRERRMAEIFLVPSNDNCSPGFQSRMVLKRILKIRENRIQGFVYFFCPDIGHRTQRVEFLHLLHDKFPWIIAHQNVTCRSIRKRGCHQFDFLPVCPAHDTCRRIVKRIPFAQEIYQDIGVIVKKKWFANYTNGT